MDWGQILSNSASFIIAPATIAYALAAVGLSVQFGYAGLLNMGIAGFMALGAYGYAISSITFGLPWYLCIVVAIAASVVYALILGIPTLRLRGDYLAIVTIAGAEVLRLLFLTSSFDQYTGSADGLTGYQGSFRDSNPFPRGSYGFGPWTMNENQAWVTVIGLVLLAIAVTIVFLLMRSPWGRVLKGIREDEDAVRALGKNVFAFKMQALVLGGIFGALGGVIYALPSSVNPGSYVTSLTFFVYTALLLGGAATIFGPVLGSVVFWVLQTFLGNVLPALAGIGILPVSSSQASTLRFILVGVALMLIVIFRPQGILGNKKELTFVK
ncbi:branched-chain amino acid ABC transporter permease [Amnibacterium flavum]|uniref:Branched-chain amino acid ABC transporter permease n=1 Tax=Amnibacterium flavum TaxID=2173173 RepID=A0A2V1HR56_9MICO|nr:branched-chain amino acid ABC transporter permease [Amnibacterium flavum]PVZ95045.1 branched-chain amino acid ABC transporter permease [Amnibacterium flavum]